jgi:hypothetical protein
MFLQAIYRITSVIILGSTFGHVFLPEAQVIASSKTAATPHTIEISDSSKSRKPSTKTAVISVEGEKTTVSLKLYEEYKNLFTTYFPDKDFLTEGVSSGEGTGVRFIANFGGVKNNNAYVGISFLNSVKNLGQLRRFVNSKSGLIASNKWRVVSRIQNTSYSWAKEKIVFRQGRDLTGTLYLGQQNGKVFYVITLYPIEYGDGFAPRADLILRNLQVGS